MFLFFAFFYANSKFLANGNLYIVMKKLKNYKTCSSNSLEKAVLTP